LETWYSVTTQTFLRAHWGVIAGADFFTTEVWMWQGLVTYYTVLVLDLASRRVQILGSTPYPNELFMQQVVRLATAQERNHQGLDNQLIAGTPVIDMTSRVQRRPRAGWAAQFLRASRLMGPAEVLERYGRRPGSARPVRSALQQAGKRLIGVSDAESSSASRLLPSATPTIDIPRLLPDTQPISTCSRVGADTPPLACRTAVASAIRLIWNDLSSQLDISERFRKQHRRRSRRLSRRLITLIFADRNRIIVIRRELPRTNSAGSARRPTA
jgi:hypothetical protein